MSDIKMTGIDPETFDRIKKNISRLLTSSLGDDDSKKGPTNVEIYNQIYSDRDDIQDPSKANKIAALRRGDGISLNDIIKIAAWKDLSLDWFILGKEQTAAPTPTEYERIKDPKVLESKELFEEAFEAEDISESRAYISKLQKEGDVNTGKLIYCLLRDDEKATISQISAGILHLFNYTNISVIGDYEINNFQIPQSLTIKITPKNDSVTGILELSDQGNRLNHYFAEEQVNTAKSYTFWDIRATLVQRLLAIACRAKESNTFEPFLILRSNLKEMLERNIEISRGRFFLGSPDKPIFDNRFKNALWDNDLYLDPNKYEPQDPMFYTLSCPTDKVPADL